MSTDPPKPSEPRPPPPETASSAPAAPRAAGAVFLANLTWLEAERLLGPNTVVVLPIGAAAKEHGPHLRLDNDLRLADYLAARVAESPRAAGAVIAPTVGYHYYPAFVEYPGSTTLRLETARDLVVDIVRSLARFGPRRFYALNTGISTKRALEPAAAEVARDGILLRFTDLAALLGPIERAVATQEGGSHADEIETSMLLVIAPDRVDMSRAVKDFSPKGGSGLTRDPHGTATYSATGIWGDPTLATRAKGERVLEAFVPALLDDLERARSAAIPVASRDAGDAGDPAHRAD